MANRILIVANSEAGQALPLTAMEKFQQVILFIGNGQNSLPIDTVSQLLSLQASQHCTIEFKQVKQGNKAAFDMQLAMFIGRLSERSADSQITLLSADASYDALVQGCKESGVRINRIDGSQPAKSAEAAPAKAAVAPAPAAVVKEVTVKEVVVKEVAPAAQAAPAAAVTKEAAAPAAAEKKPVEKPVEKESAASRNHKLISSLIGAPPRQ